MFINNEYLAKLLASLVRDEGKRIVSSGLANVDELNCLFKNALGKIVKDKSALNEKLLLDTLSTLHNDLLKVKLPGDFKDVTEEIDEKLVLILDVSDIMGEKSTSCSSDISKNNDESIIEIVLEDPEDEEEGEEDIDKEANEVVSKLQKVAQDLGRIGNHSAAYNIERMIKELTN